MPTAIQRRTSNFPAIILARDLTLGQSDTNAILRRQIENVYHHVAFLQRGTFEIGSAYLPFAPKRSYDVRSRYRFSGRLASLPVHIDD